MMSAGTSDAQAMPTTGAPLFGVPLTPPRAEPDVHVAVTDAVTVVPRRITAPIARGVRPSRQGARE